MKYAIGLGARLKFEYPGTEFSSTIITPIPGELHIQCNPILTVENDRVPVLGVNLIICFKSELRYHNLCEVLVARASKKMRYWWLDSAGSEQGLCMRACTLCESARCSVQMYYFITV